MRHKHNHYTRRSRVGPSCSPHSFDGRGICPIGRQKHIKRTENLSFSALFRRGSPPFSISYHTSPKDSLRSRDNIGTASTDAWSAARWPLFRISHTSFATFREPWQSPAASCRDPHEDRAFSLSIHTYPYGKRPPYFGSLSLYQVKNCTSLFSKHLY